MLFAWNYYLFRVLVGDISELNFSSFVLVVLGVGLLNYLRFLFQHVE